MLPSRGVTRSFVGIVVAFASFALARPASGQG
jgi:hypothetical protein